MKSFKFKLCISMGMKKQKFICHIAISYTVIIVTNRTIMKAIVGIIF